MNMHEKELNVNISDIRKKIIALQKQRQDLELKLIRSRSKMEKGSIISIYTACRKGNCKCTRGEKHGPFLYLNQITRGKLIQRYVGKESDKPTVKRVNAYMDYQKTLAKVRKITKEVDSLFNLYREKLTIDHEKNIKNGKG